MRISFFSCKMARDNTTIHLIWLLLGFSEVLFVEMPGTSWMLVILTLALWWGEFY